jgi:hypothetical protein
MDSKFIVALAMLLALGAAGYLWYSGLPPAPSASQDETAQPAAATPDVSTLPPSTLKAEMSGSWRSADDAKFTREFHADGTLIDRYEGEPDASVRGSWQVIGGGEGLPASLAAEERTIVRIAFPEEVLFLVVTALTEDKLEMAYVGGTGSLRFTRIAP